MTRQESLAGDFYQRLHAEGWTTAKGEDLEGLNRVVNYTLKLNRYECPEIKKTDVPFSSGYRLGSALDFQLRQLIAKNRGTGNERDIFLTIQIKQLDLVVQPVSQELLVLGVAGSGKTVILFNRLARLKRTDQDFNPENSYVFFPGKLNEQFLHDLITEKQLETCQIFAVREFIDQMLKEHVYPDHRNYLSLPFAKDVDGSLDHSWYSHNRFYPAVLQAVKILSEPDQVIEFCCKQIDAVNVKIDQRTEEILSRLNESGYIPSCSVTELAEKARQEIKKLSVNNILPAIQSCSRMDELEEVIEELISLLPKLIMIRGRENLLELSWKPGQKNNNPESHTSKKQNSFDLSPYLSEKPAENSYSKLLVMIEPLVQALRHLAAFAGERPQAGWEEIFGEIKCAEISKEIISCLQGSWLRDLYLIRNKFHVFRDEVRLKLEVYNYLIHHEKRLAKEDLFNKNELVTDPSSPLKYTMQFFKALNVQADHQNPFMLLEEIDAWKQTRSRFERTAQTGDGKPVEYDVISTIYHKEVLSREYDIYKPGFIRDYHEMLFHLAADVLAFGPCCKETGTTQVNIDEFQCLSQVELFCLNSCFHHPKLNLYGDFRQETIGLVIDCAEKLQFLENRHRFKTMNLDENYRNAREIVDYINDELDLSMMACGLSGQVKKAKRVRDIQLQDLAVSRYGKAAVIVKDKNQLDLNCFTHLPVAGLEEREHEKRKSVIYSIDEVKGLEFETALVLDHGLNENEKYIAYSRALKNLIILDGRAETAGRLH